MIIHGHNTGSITSLAARLEDWPGQLRWGGPQVEGAINGRAHLLNGLEQLQRFQEVSPRIPHPFWLTPQMMGEADREQDKIWLGRRLNHTQGKDIRPSNLPRQRGQRTWTDSDFFTLYEPAVREWRFHILKGQSIARGVKVWSGEGPEPTQHPIIRSRIRGWHIAHDVKPPAALRELAKSAVAAAGYDLGAVDLLELANGSGVVLEVNSRPAIRDEYTLSAYERAFRAL